MCGVLGVAGSEQAGRELYGGLLMLQHRGQDAAGILTSGEIFHLLKNRGMVEKAIHRKSLETLKGEMGIAHTRYATMGVGSEDEIQPQILSFPYGIGMAHNGNIVNYRELAKDLRLRKRRHTNTKSDIEVLLNLFADAVAESTESTHKTNDSINVEGVFAAVQKVHDECVGAYSVVTLIAGEGLLGFRDPHGIRPLVIGRKKRKDGAYAYALASESNALRFLDYELVRDVKPGEAVFIDRDLELHSSESSSKSGKTDPKPCMFEWVYFSGPESQMEGVPVYGARLSLGRALAEKIKDRIESQDLKIDLVAPIPDTSRPAAIALAECLGIPYREALIKNRYVQRTFILDEQKERERAVEVKLSPILSEIKGKHLLLVDDSIVRGTTSRRIARLAKSAGAEKVYLASTCPPIVSPCFYGIDFPDREELVAFNQALERIQKKLGVDELIYTETKDLQKALGLKGLCMACLDGNYPTAIDQAESFQEQRKKDRLGSQA
jgi:amidophosphoribosyltransferase